MTCEGLDNIVSSHYSNKTTMNIQDRIVTLLSEIGKGLYEKEAELRLGLLAALAGESIILLGPPGVAKSMVARRLKEAFSDARSFEYLMSRFSTPDDIFGPVSISKLKVSDAYERVTQGYMPEADVVFLDEIWKAGPAIQNTLLTALNEKVFRNGDREMKLPLKLLVAASNELPAEGEGLEALWDRFLVRYVSEPVKDDGAFMSMILETEEAEYSDNLRTLQISPEEYADWGKQIAQVKVDASVQASIFDIRERLKRVTDKTGETSFSIYVSDRRWKKAVNLLRVSAFVHGRHETNPTDVAVLAYCLWNEPIEREVVRDIVTKSVFAAVNRHHTRLQQQVDKALKQKRAMAALKASKELARKEDCNLILFDEFYYRLSTYNTGNTYIFASDFHRLPDMRERNAILGHLYNDQTDPVKERIRAFEKPGVKGVDFNDGRKVRLMRDREYLYIDGVRCELERYSARELAALAAKGGAEGTLAFSDHDYEADIEQIAQLLNGIVHSLHDNLFVTPSDREYIRSVVNEYLKSVAQTRADISDLLYG